MKLKRIFCVAAAIPLTLLAILIVLLFNGCHQLYDPVHEPNHVNDPVHESNTPK